MALREGDSELDSAAIVIAGKEVARYDSLRLHSSFLTPCDELTFGVGDEDIAQANEVIVSGADIKLYVNDKPQFTGFVDKRQTTYSRGAGTRINVTARDIIAPMIDSNASPKIQFSGDMTLLDVIAAVVAPFGIKTIYNDGTLNRSLQTGAVAKPTATASSLSAKIPVATVDDDGETDVEYRTVTVGLSSSARQDLVRIKVKQIKPKPEESAWQYIDRILKRFGLRMFAAADGSGVIIDRPDFDSPVIQSILHSRANADGNVKSADLTLNWEAMPSCVVCSGVSSGDATEGRQQGVIIAVNELIGVDASGNIKPEIKAIIAEHKGCVVLPIRSNLVPQRASFSATVVARPMFIKDKDSQTIEQRTAFAKRQLVAKQSHGFRLKYGMAGWSQKGAVWTVNTNVGVSDDVLAQSGTMWVLEKELTKSRGGGTEANVTVIPPGTLDYSTAE